MAGTTSNGATGQLPIKSEATTVTNKGRTGLSRRQWTLIGITVLLNVLFFSSLLCIFTQVYQIVDDPGDSANIASEVLTLVSALTTLTYVTLHSIFSLKQRIRQQQRRNESVDKRTSYVAVRFAVTLCILWLLTGGWNMIIIARRPLCLPEVAGVHSWERGKTCQMGRASIAFAMIALLASFALFGILTTVSRPFEAHFLNCKFSPSASTPTATPSASPRALPSRSASAASGRYRERGASFSTHRSTPSNVSNADVDTLDLNYASGQNGIISPAPIRSLGLGIFTSNAHPPPLPAAYAMPPRVPSVEMPLPLLPPSLSSPYLAPPPRLSPMGPMSGFIPVSIPAQYATSNWRAVHPLAPSPLGPAASRSYSNIGSVGLSPSFPYRAHYSRSSVSLTRPHRLSTTSPMDNTSAGWSSSRSNSTSPDKSIDSKSESGQQATASQIAYAILNGTRIPGTETKNSRTQRHARHASAPASAAGPFAPRLNGKAWKPSLPDQAERISAFVRSSSINFPSTFDFDETVGGSQNDKIRPSIESPFHQPRKIRSEDHLRPPVPAKSSTRTTHNGARPLRSVVVLKTDGGNAKNVTTSVLTKGKTGRMTFEEVKNKPLPRIAAL